jgi:AcrR family transcriptional regulator
MPVTKKASSRRKPKQPRSRQTVEAILDAVVRILKREGFAAITTNHIAEVAGVSIGSLYQYFPDKRAIFVALHGRHVAAHTRDPELFELLATEVPHRADGTRHFAVRFHGAFRLAIASRMHEVKKGHDLDKHVFVVTHMVESLCHGALYRRPVGLSLHQARVEIVRAVLAYLRA